MILSVDELRQHVASGLPDEALLRLLDAAESDIDAKFGPSGAVTESLPGGYADLVLGLPAGTITSVTETPDTTPLVLATDDYRIDGYILRRLTTGTNPRSSWADVTVVHTPPGTGVDRVRLQVALVKLDLSYSGYVAEATQDEARTPMPDYNLARRRVLATYATEAVMAA